MALADAIHLASARAAGATAFVTNDRRIRGSAKLEVIYLDDLKPMSRRSAGSDLGRQREAEEQEARRGGHEKKGGSDPLPGPDPTLVRGDGRRSPTDGGEHEQEKTDGEHGRDREREQHAGADPGEERAAGWSPDEGGDKEQRGGDEHPAGDEPGSARDALRLGQR